MGCMGSKLSIPGLSSTPCMEYAGQRRQMAKDVIAGHDEFFAAVNAYNEAMKGVGQSLRVFTTSTNIFDNPARTKPPSASPLALPGTGGEGTAPPTDKDMQLVLAAGGNPQAKEQLEDIAKRIDAVYVEMANHLGSQVQDAMKHTSSLSKSAMPPLTLSACKTADGNLEPIGSSLHKLYNWEQHMKDDVKNLESAKHDLAKSDKRLQKKSMKAAKDPNADLKKVRGAQGKVNAANASLLSATQSIKETYLMIEQFKLEVLYPQIVRLLPMLATYWKECNGLFHKQQAIAEEIAKLQPVVAASVGGKEEPTELSSTTPEVTGAASKAYHEVTKTLDAGLTKYEKALEHLSSSQRKYSAAVLAWVRVTQSAPGDFPKPEPAELANLKPGPQGTTNAEASFSSMANDWAKSLDRLPEAKVKESILTLCKSLKAAHEFQAQEVKQHKKVDSTKKDLAKAEHKIVTAKLKLEEVKRASEETASDPEKAKEHEIREQHVVKATADLEAATSALQAAKNKYHMERMAFEHVINEDCNSAATALQAGLPEMFRSLAEYADASATGFSQMQSSHAPWVGKV